MMTTTKGPSAERLFPSIPASDAAAAEKEEASGSISRAATPHTEMIVQRMYIEEEINTNTRKHEDDEDNTTTYSRPQP